MVEIVAVVCTYNRADDLRDCLEALSHQTLPAENYGVMVVDNNSTDYTAGVVRSFRKTVPNLVYVRETKQGLAAARNRALREARAEFVAFTDDDAMPAADWLEALHRRLSALPPEVAAVGGEVTPLWDGARPAWLGDRLLLPLSAGLKWSAKPRFLRKGEWLVEVNSAYRRSLLLEYGGFPEQLGRVGVNLLSGENAVNMLLLADGYSFYYDPAILVSHKIPKERMQKAWFRRRFFWQGVTSFFVRQYLLAHIEAHESDTRDYEDLRREWDWFTVSVPVAAEQWGVLFDEQGDEDFEQRLRVLEGVGYLLASQGVVVGR
jgi:glucosyl-dolichyl phosphate glucuronosyltransferase